MFKLTEFSFGHTESTDAPFRYCLHFCFSVFYSQHFFLILRVSVFEYIKHPLMLYAFSNTSLNILFFISQSVQSLSRVQLFATPWTAARQASLSITNSWNSPNPMSIESVMPSNHLILCRPLLFLPSIFPSIRVFSKESALRIRWPKYGRFSFSISPSNEHPGLISFRMDWLDLLAVQGTLKSFLQHHSSKASILQCSAFLIVQLSHPYITTGKTIVLTRQTFADKVMPLLLFFFFFNFIIIIIFYFTILYWFCHTSTCIRPGCTRVPHPEPSSHLPPHTIPLGHRRAPAPSFLCFWICFLG